MVYSFFAQVLTLWALGYAALVVVTKQRHQARQRRVEATTPTSIARWPELVCLCPLSAGDPPQHAADKVPAYRGRLRFVFLCAENDLTAQLRAARRVSALARRHVPAEVVLTTPRGRNPKASQLAQVPERLLRYAPVVLLLDGDVDLGSVQATELVRGLLSRKALGALWQPTVPGGPYTTRADAMAAAVLSQSPYAMPFAGLFKPQIAVGKVLALRPEALQWVGGFAASAHVLGEDLHLSQTLYAMGFSVDVYAGRPAISVRTGQSNPVVWHRLVRWHRIVVEQAPRLLWAHALFVCFWPLQMLLWAALSPAVSGLLLVSGIASATLLRVAMARRIAALCGRPTAFLPSAWAAIVGDVWLLATLVRALLSPRVCWHGRGVSRGHHIAMASRRVSLSVRTPRRTAEVAAPLSA